MGGGESRDSEMDVVMVYIGMLSVGGCLGWEYLLEGWVHRF